MTVYTLQRESTMYTLTLPSKPYRLDIAELYKTFFSKVGLNCDMAFWGWTRLQGIELSAVTETEVMQLLREGPQPYFWVDKMLVKLQIPDDEVVLSNYYEWSDIIYFTLEEPNKAEAKISWDVLLDTNPLTGLGNTREVQATFKRILPEWILSITPYSIGGE